MKLFKNIILWIWQLPQNILGFIIMKFIKIKKVTYTLNNKEIVIYIADKFFRSGFSLGNYIVLDEVNTELGYTYMVLTILHEYGHQIQSKYLGPLYLILVALPSFIFNIISRVFKKGDNWYYNLPWEYSADKLANITDNRKEYSNYTFSN